MVEIRLRVDQGFVKLSTEGFKFCALANCGAAVAILAYLGNVVGKGDPVVAPDMRFPMGMFLFGLVFCGVAMFFAYRSQLDGYPFPLQIRTLPPF